VNIHTALVCQSASAKMHPACVVPRTYLIHD
jgi:hypothetical protein